MSERIHLRTPKENGTQYADLQELVYDPLKKRSVWKFKEYLGKYTKDENGNITYEKKNSHLDEMSFWDYLIKYAEEKSVYLKATLDAVLAGNVIKPTKKSTSKVGVPRKADNYIYYYQQSGKHGYELAIDLLQNGCLHEVSILLGEDTQARNNADYEVQLIDPTDKDQKAASRIIYMYSYMPKSLETRDVSGYHVTCDPKFDYAVRYVVVFKELIEWIDNVGKSAVASPDQLSEILSAILACIHSIQPIFFDRRLALLCKVLFAGGNIYRHKGEVLQCGFTFKPN